MAACAGYCLLAAALAALLMLLYLWRIGLPPAIAERILRAMPASAMAVTADRIRLSVFEGVIAENARFYRRGDIGSPLVEAREVVLSFNPLEWFKRRIGLTGVRVKDASTRFPMNLPPLGGLSAPASPAVEHINAKVLFAGRSVLQVQELSGLLLGVKVSGGGEVLLPADDKDWLKGGSVAGIDLGAGRATSALARVSAYIKEMQVDPFRIDVEFSIDAGDMKRSRARALVTGGVVAAPGWSVGAWQSDLGFSDGRVAATLLLKNPEFRGVRLEEVVCGASYDGGSPRLESLDAVFAGESGGGKAGVSCDFNLEDMSFTGSLATSFDPHAIIPALEHYRLPQTNVVRDFEFRGAPPKFSAKFSGKLGDDSFFLMSGRASASNLVFRGAPADSVETDLTLSVSGDRGELNFSPMEAHRPEGAVRGELFFDFKEQSVYFQAKSSVSPHAAAAWIGPFLSVVVGHFRCEGPAIVTASGRAGFSDMSLNDMEILVDGRKIGFWKLDIEDCFALIRMLGDTVVIESVKGAFNEGSIEGSGEARTYRAGENMRHYFTAHVVDAAAGRVAQSLGMRDAEKYQGMLSIRLDIEGWTGPLWRQSLLGQGETFVKGGRVFQFPLLGGLSGILSRVIPGLDWLISQSDASADFTIENDRVYSDNVLMEGDVFALDGKGSCGFDGTLDFNVRVKFLRQHTFVAEILRTLMWPVSKILEVSLGGTVAEPRWLPRGLQLYGVFE